MSNFVMHLPLSDVYCHIYPNRCLIVTKDSKFQEFLPPFVLDADYFEKTEDEIATLGEQLECAFGWKARTSDAGILPIQESGPAICAVHTVLEHYHHKYLGSTHPCAETKTLRP